MDKLSKEQNVIKTNLGQKVNDIWEAYLTSPFEINQLKEFKFLINKEGLNSYQYIEYEDLPLFTADNHYLELISSVNQLNDDDIGFIVSVDWTKTDKFLLPADFENNNHFVKSNLKPLAVFTTSIGEGIINPVYERAAILADQNNLLLIDLNKRLFDPNFSFTKGMKEQFIINVISYFMLEHNLNMNFKLRNQLVKKYGQFIIQKYLESIEEQSFEPSIFLNHMLSYIKEQENYHKVNRNY